MLDAREVEAALILDEGWCTGVRDAWTRVADLAVFGDVRAEALGAMPRMRKRVLDLGERLRALLADRAWIPQPRERLKNALASAIAARDALAEVEGQARTLAGPDAEALRDALGALNEALTPVLGARANAWAALLARRSRGDDNSPDEADDPVAPDRTTDPAPSPRGPLT